MLKSILDLFEEAAKAWNRDNAVQLSAALAFYAALSLAPLLTFGITLVGVVTGQTAMHGEIVAQSEEVLGQHAAETIRTIAHQANIPRLTNITLATLIIGGSGVFWQGKKAINRAWGIRRLSDSRIKNLISFIRGRVLAFAMVIGAGLLLLISLTLDTSLALLRRTLTDLLPELVTERRLLYGVQVLKFVLALTLISFAVMIVYKVLPDADIAWKDAGIGAAMTSFLLSISNLVMGRTLSNLHIGSAYGPAGSLLAFLIWVYVTALIFFYGAEFTRAYANRYGSGITPYHDTLIIVHQKSARLDPGEWSDPVFAIDDGESIELLSVDEVEQQMDPASLKRPGQILGALAAATAVTASVYYVIRRNEQKHE
jgi:membrane protein